MKKYAIINCVKVLANLGLNEYDLNANGLGRDYNYEITKSEN